jgi:hypothetical protein
MTGELIGGVPSRIGSLQEMQDPTFVSAAHVVVDSEEISIVVECELLRVSQTSMKDFKMTPVWVASKDGSTMAFMQSDPVMPDDIVSTVADCKVDHSVWPLNQSVKIMTVDADAHPEAFVQCLFEFGFPILIFVL